MERGFRVWVGSQGVGRHLSVEVGSKDVGRVSGGGGEAFLYKYYSYQMYPHILALFMCTVCLADQDEAVMPHVLMHYLGLLNTWQVLLVLMTHPAPQA